MCCPWFSLRGWASRCHLRRAERQRNRTGRVDHSLGGPLSSARQLRACLVLEGYRYGIRAWVGDLAGRVNLRLDQVLLSFFCDKSALGLYSIAVLVSELLWFLPDSMAFVLFNKIAAAPTLETRAELTSRVHRVLFLAMSLVGVAMAITAPWLIPLAFGSDFAPAVWPLLILLPGTVAMTTQKVVTKYLSGTGQPGKSSLIITLGATTGTLAALVLIPSFQIRGAAWASCAGYIVTLVAAAAIYGFAISPRPTRLFRCSLADIQWLVVQLRSIAPPRSSNGRSEKATGVR